MSNQAEPDFANAGKAPEPVAIVKHPYEDLPDTAFWRRAVASRDAADIDPVFEPPFRITRNDRVATAGSCFAQRLSATIRTLGFNYHVPESGPATDAARDENYGVYSARYGNIYTTAQLSQLFERAYGLFEPDDDVWIRPDGACVDPFRPRVQAAGFASAQAVRADRETHLARVREVFETCDVFLFTLGLTECWASALDGAVVPLPPGVSGAPASGQAYEFENLRVPRMTEELLTFVDRLRRVNPDCKVVLTVSPVSIIATWEKRHVVVSNGYSKAALRVVAETVTREREMTSYFPSYEMTVGPAAAGRYLTPDRRQVTAEGVALVTEAFARHFLTDEERPARPPEPKAPASPDSFADLEALEAVVCDEEAMDR